MSKNEKLEIVWPKKEKKRNHQFSLKNSSIAFLFGHFQNDALFVVFCSHALNYIQKAQVIWHVLSYEK